MFGKMVRTLNARRKELKEAISDLYLELRRPETSEARRAEILRALGELESSLSAPRPPAGPPKGPATGPNNH